MANSDNNYRFDVTLLMAVSSFHKFPTQSKSCLDDLLLTRRESAISVWWLPPRLMMMFEIEMVTYLFDVAFISFWRALSVFCCYFFIIILVAPYFCYLFRSNRKTKLIVFVFFLCIFWAFVVAYWRFRVKRCNRDGDGLLPAGIAMARKLWIANRHLPNNEL